MCSTLLEVACRRLPSSPLLTAEGFSSGSPILAHIMTRSTMASSLRRGLSARARWATVLKATKRSFFLEPLALMRSWSSMVAQDQWQAMLLHCSMVTSVFQMLSSMPVTYLTTSSPRDPRYSTTNSLRLLPFRSPFAGLASSFWYSLLASCTICSNTCPLISRPGRSATCIRHTQRRSWPCPSTSPRMYSLRMPSSCLPPITPRKLSLCSRVRDSLMLWSTMMSSFLIMSFIRFSMAFSISRECLWGSRCLWCVMGDSSSSSWWKIWVFLHCLRAEKMELFMTFSSRLFSRNSSVSSRVRMMTRGLLMSLILGSRKRFIMPSSPTNWLTTTLSCTIFSFSIWKRAIPIRYPMYFRAVLPQDCGKCGPSSCFTNRSRANSCSAGGQVKRSRSSRYQQATWGCCCCCWREGLSSTSLRPMYTLLSLTWQVNRKQASCTTKARIDLISGVCWFKSASTLLQRGRYLIRCVRNSVFSSMRAQSQATSLVLRSSGLSSERLVVDSMGFVKYYQ